MPPTFDPTTGVRFQSASETTSPNLAKRLLDDDVRLALQDVHAGIRQIGQHVDVRIGGRLGDLFVQLQALRIVAGHPADQR